MPHWLIASSSAQPSSQVWQARSELPLALQGHPSCLPLTTACTSWLGEGCSQNGR